MTGAAGMPGVEAFAAFYARLAEALRSQTLAAAAEPLTAEGLALVQAVAGAWPGLVAPDLGSPPHVGALRTRLGPWLQSAESVYQQWARSASAREAVKATLAGYGGGDALAAAGATLSAARSTTALPSWGLPAEGSLRTLVQTDGAARLYHYGSARPRRSTPLLLVYALVNRPSILDLEPDRSLIRGLVDAGRDVYLLDWGDPSDADHARLLDDYVLGILGRAVTTVGRGRPIDLLGVCQGGVLSLLYAARQPRHVRRLVTMVTPVDFHTPDDLLSQWARAVETPVGIDPQPVPGVLLDALFQSLAPFRLGVGKIIDLLDHVQDEAWVRRFRRMEQWVHDGPDHPARLCTTFLTEFYQQNRFVTGGLALAGQAVDLHQIHAPLLNVYGLHDHIVPAASSRALARLTQSKRYTEIAVPTGHIGVFVSARASALPAQIAAWLARR